MAMLNNQRVYHIVRINSECHVPITRHTSLSHSVRVEYVGEVRRFYRHTHARTCISVYIYIYIHIVLYVIHYNTYIYIYVYIYIYKFILHYT